MTSPLATTTLPDELAHAVWSQWSVNGHDLDAALAFVHAHHMDTAMRSLAGEAMVLAKSLPIVRAAYESVCWERERGR